MEISKQNWCFEANLNFLIQMLCGERLRNSNTEISRERRLSGVGTGNASSLHLHNTQTFTSANTLSYFPSAYTKIPLRSWLLPKNILLLLKSHPPPNGNNIWDSPDSAKEGTLRQILDLIRLDHLFAAHTNPRDLWIILFTSHVTHFVVGVALLK